MKRKREEGDGFQRENRILEGREGEKIIKNTGSFLSSTGYGRGTLTYEARN